jgi:hypothetical protein
MKTTEDDNRRDDHMLDEIDCPFCLLRDSRDTSGLAGTGMAIRRNQKALR